MGRPRFVAEVADGDTVARDGPISRPTSSQKWLAATNAAKWTVPGETLSLVATFETNSQSG